LKYSAVPQPAVDLALAARLEAAHAWAVSNYVRSLQERRRELGADAIPVAGGQAFYAGPSPFSFAVNVGIGRVVTSEEVDRVEAFYFKRGAPAKIDVTPATHSSIAAILRDRGYRMEGHTSVLMLEVGNEDFRHAAPEVILRWATDADCDQWVDTVAQTFFVTDPGEERRRNIACVFHAPHALNVIAKVNDRLAGVAGCMIPHGGGMAVLYASCTLPEFRRMGIHREMLRLRIAAARGAGCDSILATALPGSDSERNLERWGFEACYVKTTWAKAVVSSR
jgi:GNAT superfamily N-acetyltransferase